MIFEEQDNLMNIITGGIKAQATPVLLVRHTKTRGGGIPYTNCLGTKIQLHCNSIFGLMGILLHLQYHISPTAEKAVNIYTSTVLPAVCDTQHSKVFHQLQSPATDSCTTAADSSIFDICSQHIITKCHLLNRRFFFIFFYIHYMFITTYSISVDP